MTFNYSVPEKEEYKSPEIPRQYAIMIFYSANVGRLTLKQALIIIENNFQGTTVPVSNFGTFLKGWFSEAKPNNVELVIKDLTNVWGSNKYPYEL